MPELEGILDNLFLDRGPELTHHSHQVLQPNTQQDRSKTEQITPEKYTAIEWGTHHERNDFFSLEKIFEQSSLGSVEGSCGLR
ncbi:hypothetical protein LguiB_013814 [Lonicera macranthoides]